MNEQYFEEIDNYWKGLLSNTENVDFESRLKNDKALATSLQQIKTLKYGIAYSHLQDKLAQFKEIEETYGMKNNEKKEDLGELIIDANRMEKNQALLNQFQSIERQIKKDTITAPVVKTKNRTSLWKMAAGFLILIIAVFLIYFNQSTSDPQQLSIKSFESYPHPYTVRDTESSLIKDAFSAYDFGQFEKAIPLMQEITDERTEPIFDFHLAVAYLGNQEAKKAIPIFQKISPDLPHMQEQIYWYLGLCYLQEKEVDIAKKYFLQIKRFNQEKLKKLLKQLD